MKKQFFIGIVGNADWGIACQFGNCGSLSKAVEIGLCSETVNPLLP